MSELKAMKFFEAVPTSKEGFYQPGAFVDGYHKSEADKVIAHHKYKRCLAMARWCKRKRIDAADYRIPRGKWEFYDKWHKRWRELAEKFKEEK